MTGILFKEKITKIFKTEEEEDYFRLYFTSSFPVIIYKWENNT